MSCQLGELYIDTYKTARAGKVHFRVTTWVYTVCENDFILACHALFGAIYQWDSSSGCYILE